MTDCFPPWSANVSLILSHARVHLPPLCLPPPLIFFFFLFVRTGEIVEWRWNNDEQFDVTSGERGSLLAGVLFQSQASLQGSFAVRFLVSQCNPLVLS